MKVKELIAELKKLPQDAQVYYIWDGEPRSKINAVYEAKNGDVMTADFWETVYSTQARPKDAPTREKEPHWETHPVGYPSIFELGADYQFTHNERGPVVLRYKGGGSFERTTDAGVERWSGIGQDSEDGVPYFLGYK